MGSATHIPDWADTPTACTSHVVIESGNVTGTEPRPLALITCVSMSHDSGNSERTSNSSSSSSIRSKSSSKSSSSSSSYPSLSSITVLAIAGLKPPSEKVRAPAIPPVSNRKKT
ncbi:hypothetical protein NP493_55g05033 [Ridgeia piscesae]|uniref:Uncharacterized protein n=1 Tax=Ridgeia piscesae TaxID=27915 RepID=A0AAD9PAI0_RIDPI|nr:hypothetical protein NP493_55g05033 [Ridgeia piscesae]